MRRGVLWFLTLLLAGGVLGFAGWKLARNSADEFCYACRRPVQSRLRTVATLAGHTAVFCSPACAFSDHHLGHRPVHITALTDYRSGRPIAPEGAWMVREPGTGPTSLLAFARREDAEAYAAKHGGRVLSLADVVAARASR